MRKKKKEKLKYIADMLRIADVNDTSYLSALLPYLADEIDEVNGRTSKNIFKSILKKGITKNG